MHIDLGKSSYIKEAKLAFVLGFFVKYSIYECEMCVFNMLTTSSKKAKKLLNPLFVVA